MSKDKKLIILKVIHTILWIVIVSLIGYICYAGIFNQLNNFLWIALVIVASEGIILLGNKFVCPLTNLARTYTDNRVPGYDIYLPRWLAKYTIPLFTIFAIIGGILVLIRVLTQ